MCTAAPFTIAKRWQQPKCPSVEEWMNKCASSAQRGYWSATGRMKFWSDKCYIMDEP